MDDQLTVIDGTLNVRVAPPRLNMVFHHSGTVVGRLWLEDDLLRFEGNLDASAVALFEAIRPMVDGYIRGRVVEGVGEIEGVPC